MKNRLIPFLCLAVGSTAMAQSSSMMRLPDQRPVSRSEFSQPETIVAGAGGNGFAAMGPDANVSLQTKTIERMSLIAIPSVPPRKYKVNDIISILVKQQKTYTADGKLDTKKEWNLDSILKDWPRMYQGGHAGAQTWPNGNPDIAYHFKDETKSKATNDREDKFTTRIAARVVDVKPNGTLTLEATMTEQHDDEQFTITLTGSCRSEDVTPDNSVLSTQIAELVLIEKNKGSVRDETKRGWIPRLLGEVGPF